MNYTGNDGQVITAIDAMKIANALRISLDGTYLSNRYSVN
jgi:hypothetical protein